MSVNNVSEEQKSSSDIEDDTLKQLSALEKDFREHNTLVKKEMQIQKELLARMWVLSQRYVILDGTETYCRYPQIYTGPAEDNILNEYTDKLRQIRVSNFRLTCSLDKLRKSCIAFENLCAQLDMTKETPFILGDAFHKPIAFFIELVSDLFKYFHAWLLKLKVGSHQFDPYRIDGVQNYKTKTEISEDFEEYLNVGLTYCKCLRPKRLCN